MGIPGFTGWFSKQHSSCYAPLSSFTIDHLYVDANSLIHGAIRNGATSIRFPIYSKISPSDDPPMHHVLRPCSQELGALPQAPSRPAQPGPRGHDASQVRHDCGEGLGIASLPGLGRIAVGGLELIHMPSDNSSGQIPGSRTRAKNAFVPLSSVVTFSLVAAFRWTDLHRWPSC